MHLKALPALFLPLFVIFGLTACQNSLPAENHEPVEKPSKTITIFTLDPLLAIHAKMITGENEQVILGSGENARIDLENIKKSNLILATIPREKYVYMKDLTDFSGIYTSIPIENPDNVLKTLPELKNQINRILDAIVTADLDNRGAYYDNAGGYIYTLENIFERFSFRIKEYNYTPFITIGPSYANFIELYDLGKYHLAHYKTLEDFLIDKKWENNSTSNTIKTLFTPAITPKIREDIAKKYGVAVYTLAPLTEDTSGWGYVRYLGKVMNNFANAFDTYD